MTFAIGLILLILVAILLLYVFLILPRVSAGADMEPLLGSYAHRGLWGKEIPENSLSAFAAAARAGYGIELDLQMSRDGQIMVFHDDDLRRMCGVNRRISDLTCAQLKTLRLKHTQETIPTLIEVLQLIRGRVPLMLEFKGELPNQALCKRVCRLMDLYHGAFCVVSFSPLILRWFKHYRPSYARGQLVTKAKRSSRRGSRTVGFLLTHFLLNPLSRPDFVSVNVALRRRLSVRLLSQAFRTPCFLWTVRTEEEYRDCRSRGFFPIFESVQPKSIQKKRRKP